MKKPKFQSPTGMHDILPEDQKYYQKILDVVLSISEYYQFEKIDTPILEDTELFLRGLGSATDIVGREMYSLKTKGGDYLTMRPEGTAPVARAYIEHGMFSLPQPIKLWYNGPFFRHENPQAGRLRQFWSFGFEILGDESSVVDAQIIQIFYNILRELKFKNIIIEVNSIGDSQCRPYYKKLLVSYFRSREHSLCSDCKRRLRENPLRILDCKDEKCQQIKSQAPQMLDHLCEECHKRFKEVLEFLDEIELPYRLNPFLVRGLDYYTKTVFEMFEDSEEGKKIGALCGGGRYDNLIKMIGGKDAPACGGAGGTERIIALMKTKGTKFSVPATPKIFLAQLGDLAKRKSLRLMERFRQANIDISESLGRDSFKAQLRIADKIGAKYTLILGQKEALEGNIIIRDMKTGKQETIKLDKIVAEVAKRLKK